MKKLFYICVVFLLLAPFSIAGCSAENTDASGAISYAEVSPSKTPTETEQADLVPQLINQSQDSSLITEERKSAIEELGKTRDKRAVEPLIELLEEKNTDYIESVITALGDIGDDRAVQPIIDYIVSVDGYYEVCGFLEMDSATVNDTNLSDTYPYYYAAAALKKLGYPAVEKLVSCLNNTNDEIVKGKVLIVLGEIGDSRTVKALIDFSLNDDSQMNLKHCAENALIMIGSQAVEPLIDMVNNYEGYISEEAAKVLGKIKDTRAVEPLVMALQNSEQVYNVWNDSENYIKYGEVIAQALGNIGDVSAVETLIGMMKDKSEDRWKFSAEALGIMGGDKSVTALLSELDSDNDEVRYVIARAINTSDPKYSVRLEKALEDKDLAIIAGAYSYYMKRISKSNGAEQTLIDALNKAGDVQMAEAFLNSGNETLFSAGEKWCQENGYMVRPAF